MLDYRTLSLADARKIVAAAAARAGTEGWKVSIAVLDRGGHLLCFERTDGAPLGSVRVSQEKARAAVMFGRPTRAFQDMVSDGRVNMMALPGAVPVEGGLPLLHDGVLVGAIGVSGVTSAQDGQVAAAGVAALG